MFRQAVYTFFNMVENHSECPRVERKTLEEAGSSTFTGLDKDMIVVVPCLFSTRSEEDVKAVVEYWSLDSLERMFINYT